jgi:hypothetical protein
MNLMNKDNINNNNNIDRDCVICLCPVGPNDKMKILYCNHVFHDHCLTEWFKKNRVMFSFIIELSLLSIGVQQEGDHRSLPIPTEVF